jgi:hypothetical protein
LCDWPLLTPVMISNKVLFPLWGRPRIPISIINYLSFVIFMLKIELSDIQEVKLNPAYAG